MKKINHKNTERKSLLFGVKSFCQKIFGYRTSPLGVMPEKVEALRSLYPASPVKKAFCFLSGRYRIISSQGVGNFRHDAWRRGMRMLSILM